MRRRIWEIDAMFRCPVATYCFSQKEQKQLHKKSEMAKTKLSKYELHELLISKMCVESPFAVRMEKMLNEKYKEEIEEWIKLSSYQWKSVFEKNLSYSTVGVLLWVTAIKDDLFYDVEMYNFGLIHTLHGSMLIKVLEQKNSLEKYKKKNEDLEEHLNDQRHEIGVLLRSKKEIEDERAKDDRKYEALRNESTAEIEKLKNELNSLVGTNETDQRSELDSLNKQIKKLKSNTRYLNDKLEQRLLDNEKIREEVEKKDSFIESMREEVEKLLKVTQDCECSDCELKNTALCNRRVLIVGGISKLLSFYKQTVTNMGAELDYHDGVPGSNNDVLKQHIDKSDIVLCPVDVNSHGACLLVKKRCKKLRKPFFMLPSSSISSVQNTLIDIVKKGSS